MKRNIVLVVSALAFAGCFHPQSHSNYPFGEPQGVSESSSTTSTTTASTATAAITAPPASPQVAAQQPRPPQVEVRKLGSVVMYDTMTQAPDIMSVKVTNTSPYFASLESPTFASGEPVFKLRYGSYEQDFLPSHPGWRQVTSAAVLMPNETQNTENGPEAWLAVKYVGTFNLVAKFYTYDGVNPQYTGITISERLVFPNTWRKNPTCPQWYAKGCLHNFPLRASLESDGHSSFQIALYSDYLNAEGKLVSQRLIVDETNQYVALGDPIVHDGSFAQR